MENKKPSIGVICRPKLNPTEKHLFPLLKKEFNLISFPVQKDIDYEKLIEQAKDVKIILNTAGDVPNVEDALEMVKTFEGMNKHVIDSSHSFYYKEDKWLFYQLCVKHNFPTPKTYYIPRDIELSKDKLREILDEGPVVFKGIFSDAGRAVKRALNYEEALKVLKSLRKKIGSMPLIAQRYIPHGTVSYRVTLFEENIIQSIIKHGKTWKEGGLFWKNEKYKKFTPDKKLADLCKKVARVFKIEWCGIDLMRDDKGKWYIIEVNSCPSMDFVLSDVKRANKEFIKYIHRLNRKLENQHDN